MDIVDKRTIFIEDEIRKGTDAFESAVTCFEFNLGVIKKSYVAKL
jgi:hypothetical protein